MCSRWEAKYCAGMGDGSPRNVPAIPPLSFYSCPELAGARGDRDFTPRQLAKLLSGPNPTPPPHTTSTPKAGGSHHAHAPAPAIPQTPNPRPHTPPPPPTPSSPHASPSSPPQGQAEIQPDVYVPELHTPSPKRRGGGGGGKRGGGAAGRKRKLVADVAPPTKRGGGAAVPSQGRKGAGGHEARAPASRAPVLLAAAPSTRWQLRVRRCCGCAALLRPNEAHRSRRRSLQSSA